MEVKTKILLRGILTVIGAVLIQLSLGIIYVFGNYTPYMTSYLRNMTSSSDVTYGETTWIATSATIAASVIGPFLSLLERVLNYRPLLALSCFIYSGGVIGSYFTIKYSMIALTITYGVCTGLGRIVAYAAALKCSIEWFPERGGLVSGLVLAGYGLSSFILNWVVTLSINPDNLTPNLQVDNNKYFTQESVLSNVPESFLILGAILVGLQIIGIILVSDAKHYKKSIYEVIISPEEEASQYGSINSDKPEVETSPTFRPRDFEVIEVLKSTSFYIIWFMLVLLEFSVAFLALCYKTYGQTFIHNDHFLALVGSLSSIFNAGGRVFWGIVGDKITHMLSMCILTACFSIFISTLVLISNAGGQYPFLIWMCLIYFSFSGIFSVVTVIVMELYGTKNYLTIYNAIKSSGAVSAVGASIIISTLEYDIGWENIILLTAGLTVAGFLLAVILEIFSIKQTS